VHTDDGIDQHEVFAREWRDVRVRRRLDPAENGSPPPNLVGLALSGGGIRSATFCLGVLQALRDLRLLERLDYLSTVSGGGFIGGWWSAWLARDENLQLFPPPEGIEPANRLENRANGAAFVEGGWFAGHDPIHHLRLFANYLTPRKGALSPDSWRAITVISRNMLLTWAVVIPLVIGLVLMGQAYFVSQESLAGFFSPTPDVGRRIGLCLGLLEGMGAVVVLLSVAWLLMHRGDSSLAYLGGIAGVVVATAMVAGGSTSGSGTLLNTIRTTAPWSLPGLALVLYAFRTPGGGIKIESRRDLWRNQIVRIHATVLVVALVATATLAITGFGHWFATWIAYSSGTWLRTAGIGSVLLTIGSAIVTAYKVAPTGGADRDRTEASLPVRIAIAVAPPLVLVMLCLLCAWASGWLVDRQLRPDVLWYPVFIAVAMCTGFAFLDLWLFEGVPSAATVVLFLFLLLALTAQTTGLFDWVVEDRSWAIFVPAAGTVVTLAVETARGRCGRRSMWLFGAAILLVTAYLSAPTDDLRTMLCFVALCVVWVVGLGWMTDPNMVSLHGFYKARLVRAYLGASNRRRYKEAREITEAATGDDILLRELRNCEKGGPYHLINTTLNLVGGSDLTTAQRCAATFTLARHHCGSWRTRYRRTDDYMGGDLSLGTAVAISGAAASPNMGSSTPSSALALLMTFLNIRLGFWAPTPNRSDWRSPQARMWPFYLLKESLSQTNDLTTYCYLTDGGHFDNTGIYSLVERGCRYIVAVDCGADPDFCYEDLGNAMRRCRIDFGVDIDPELGAFTAPTSRHFIVARIVYAEKHVESLGWTDTSLKARTGVIVVIKPRIVGGQPADAWQYGKETSVFPQQTTADQWFDEAQFESYRRLGEASAIATFDSFKGIGDAEALFERMYKAWIEPPDERGLLTTQELAARKVIVLLAN
jgi:hypothetical protein